MQYLEFISDGASW